MAPDIGKWDVSAIGVLARHQDFQGIALARARQARPFGAALADVFGAGPPVMAAEATRRLVPIGGAERAPPFEGAIFVVEGEGLEIVYLVAQAPQQYTVGRRI